MTLKPTELVNWTSYMVAIYLTGDYKTALEVFDTIEQTINGIENAEKKPKPQERNEIYLFKAKILEDSQDWKAGIKFLTKKSVEKIILDDVRKNEFLAKFYCKHGLTKKGIECLEKLLQLNSNNKAYYRQILEAQGINVEKPSAENDQKVYDIL